MVSPFKGFFQLICSRWHKPQIDLFCNKVQLQIATVCVTGSRLPILGSQCTLSTLGGPGLVCIPISRHSGPSGGKAEELPKQENHPDCSRVVQNVLVLGPGRNVKADMSVPAKLAQFTNSTIQPDCIQEPMFMPGS